MGIYIQRICEQLINTGSAELARRQTDSVYDDQFRLAIGWALICVWGLDAPDAISPTGVGIDLHSD
jgi:hypothetical protein